MNRGMVNTFLLISVVSCSGVAQGQSPGSDSTRHAMSSEASGMTPAPGGSWESWLNHGAGSFAPESQVHPRSPDLGRAAPPLSSSIGPESGLIGPEGSSAPSRPGSRKESDPSGTMVDRNRR
ncbi:MAG: hypothetical protein K0S45_1175 [Nitrospira sp.]|jgi:hypothetical protein|nr:hypothetical protein [Nitrospira sp.]